MHQFLDMVDLAAKSYACIGVRQQLKTKDKSLERGWTCGCTFGNNKIRTTYPVVGRRLVME